MGEFLLFVLVAVAPVFVGRSSAKRERRPFVAVAFVLVVATLVAVWLSQSGPADNPERRVMLGTAIGGGGAALWMALYVVIGRVFTRPGDLVVALICSAPVYVGVFYGIYKVADLAACSPNAYECPL